MTQLTVPWADETLSMQLPPDWTVQQVGTPSLPPARPDWAENLARAIDNPEESLPLGKLLAARRGGRIVLVLEDMTRHSPLKEILPLVLREITHAKVESDVEIIFASGMHPPMTPQEVSEKIGPELASQFKWRSNDPRDRRAMLDLGSVRVNGSSHLDLAVDRRLAEADLRIIVSSVSPHLQAGFGGGYKMFVPGCAGLETIRQLHLLGVPRTPRQQVGEQVDVNPMRQAIDAAGRAIDAHGGKTFAVQYVLDVNDGVSTSAAGDVNLCQQMLAKQCAAGCGVVVDSPADVVIANACPRDFDLWQSFKAIANTTWAARENGVIICLSRCPAGANMPTVSLPVTPELVRGVIRFVGAQTISTLATRLIPGLAGERAFFVRLACRMLEKNPIYIVSPELAKRGAKFVGLAIFETPEQAFAAAEKHLGSGSKRVTVFPHGGISYPLLRRGGEA